MLDTIHLQYVPIITALVSVLKIYIPRKHAPLLSLGVGILFSLGANSTELSIDNWFDILLEGIVLGLSASGLYSFPGVKRIEGLMGIAKKD